MRLLAAITVALSFVPAPARAGRVVLMVNMNYSSQELQALEEVAASRGQRLEVVPPREMTGLAEPMFIERDKLIRELQRAFPGKSEFDVKVAVYGMMREGSSWSSDPQLAAAAGRRRIDSLYGLAKRVSQAESRYGSVYSQLQKKGRELRAAGDQVDTLALSSHSDGSNLTGETGIRLSATELAGLRREQPWLIGGARHNLLLGCYNLTRAHHKTWRYTLFPDASLIAGFGKKAPSRFNRQSADFIRQTLATAHELDRKMMKAEEPLNPAYVERLFKALPSFTAPAYPGVVDYCYNVLEGRPGAWSQNCDEQWAELYEKRESMRDYWSLVRPREDPPSVGEGALRAFYNVLQDACPARETESQKDDWRASELLRVTLREMTIRLLFWWNVQHNFSAHNGGAIRAMAPRLARAGVSGRLPKLDGTASRVAFVEAYNSVFRQLSEEDPVLATDFETLYSPLFLLQGEDTVAPGERISVEETLARGAIPFNWIEGDIVGER